MVTEILEVLTPVQGYLMDKTFVYLNNRVLTVSQLVSLSNIILLRSHYLRKKNNKPWFREAPLRKMTSKVELLLTDTVILVGTRDRFVWSRTCFTTGHRNKDDKIYHSDTRHDIIEFTEETQRSKIIL